MNAKTLTAIALGIGLAVIAGVAWSSHREAQEAEAALALLAKKRAAVAARTEHLQNSVTYTERDNQEIKAAISVETAAGPKGKIRITPRRSGANMIALLAADPKLSALASKMFRENLNVNFAHLFRVLNLNPDQIAKFDALASTHQDAIFDILSSASSQGIPLNDPAIATLMQQENAQYQKSQQALLGDAGYAQMQDANRALPVSGIVRGVASQVALTSTPLTTTQADQLTQILANSSPQYQSGGRASQGSINWATALGQAQAILSPGQFAALQGSYNSIQVNQFKSQFDKQEAGN
jgi:hypothetical protein